MGTPGEPSTRDKSPHERHGNGEGDDGDSAFVTLGRGEHRKGHPEISGPDPKGEHTALRHRKTASHRPNPDEQNRGEGREGEKRATSESSPNRGSVEVEAKP